MNPIWAAAGMAQGRRRFRAVGWRCRLDGGRRDVEIAADSLGPYRGDKKLLIWDSRRQCEGIPTLSIQPRNEAYPLSTLVLQPTPEETDVTWICKPAQMLACGAFAAARRIVVIREICRPGTAARLIPGAPIVASSPS